MITLRMSKVWAVVALAVLASAAFVAAQDLPRGRIIDAVTCSGDATESYALFLPSNYTPDRAWPLLMGFHPGARGRAIVDTYQAAAEAYGYIVVGSNNSRNGPWEVSGRAVTAMTADIAKRFPIAAGRFYMTGLSGGSRVALQVALATKKIDGVIASSAGYPDSQPRTSVPFVIFGTAGADDFNYIEMKLLGRELKTPHRIVIFDGGHQLPPPPVAMRAIEWLEVQAMAKGSRTKDAALVERLFQKGLAAADLEATPAVQAEALASLASDFTGLRDVTALNDRVATLMKDKDVKRALSQSRADDFAEARMLNELIELHAGLADSDARPQTLLQLHGLLARLHKTATAADDSDTRRQARRVLRAVTAGSADEPDAEYRALVQQFRVPGSGRGGDD